MSDIATMPADNIDETNETVTTLSKESKQTSENIKSFGETSKSTGGGRD